MAAPSANKSVRAPCSVWAGVEAAAKAEGVKVNAWVVRVMGAALGSGEPAARPAEGKAPPPAARVAAAAEAVKGAEVVQASGVQIGPQRPAPGQRLKRQGR